MESVTDTQAHTSNIFVSTRDWLAQRDYRPLWHLLAVVSIIAAACFLFYKHFSTPGVLMHTDMTWPSPLPRLNGSFLHTWWQYGSKSNISTMQRLFWVYPLLLPATLFHLSQEHFLLITYVFTFSLAGVSMYALCYQVVGSLEFKNLTRYAPFLGAILAALVYMYNPWSIGHFWSYFMFPTYAMIPLVFLCCRWTLSAPSVKRAIVLGLLMAYCGTGPLMVIWLWILVITYAIFHVGTGGIARKSLLATLKVLLQTAVFFALFCAMWMMPYLGAVLSHKTLVPKYASPVSSNMIAATSAHNSVVNNLRLVSGWGYPVGVNPTNSLLVVLSFAMPILALATLLVMRDRFKKSESVNYWSAMFVLSILIATGSSFILNKPYLYVALDSPASNQLGWLFRAPDRWLVFVPVFYALMLGILLTSLMGRGKRTSKRLRISAPINGPHDLADSDQATLFETASETAPMQDTDRMRRLEVKLDRFESMVQNLRHYGMLMLAFIVVGTVLLSYYPVTLLYAQRVMNPTRIPAQYENVNRFLAKKDPDSQVLWLPYWGANRYAWAGGKRLGPFEIFSSNPSIFQFVVTSNTYGYWLQNEIYQPKGVMGEIYLDNRPQSIIGNLSSALLAPYGAIFVVVDTSIPGTNFASFLKSDRSVTAVYRSGNLVVYQMPHSPGVLRAADKTVVQQSFFDYLSILEKVGPGTLSDATFVDHSSGIPKTMTTYDLANYQLPVIQNGDFEAGQGGIIPGWTLQGNQRNTVVTLDKEKPSWSKGESSLKVVNKETRSWGISWITGTEVAAVPHQMYTVETSVKYQNVVWSSAVIEGYSSREKQWRTLIRCPNIMSLDLDWRKWNSSFVLPDGYTKIRPKLGAGWVANKGKGPATSWFDDINVSRVQDRLFEDLSKPTPVPTIQYTKRSPEKYEVKITNAEKPFMLVFSQAYDPLWVAKTDQGEKIESVSCYSMINGFPVDVQNKKDFTITIEYLPQRWFYLGLLLSLGVLLLCMIYLLYDWRLGKRLKVTAMPLALARGIPPILRTTGKHVKPESRRNKRLTEKSVRATQAEGAPFGTRVKRPPSDSSERARSGKPRRGTRSRRKALRAQRKKKYEPKSSSRIKERLEQPRMEPKKDVVRARRKHRPLSKIREWLEQPSKRPRR